MKTLLAKISLILLFVIYSSNSSAQWSGGSPPPPPDPDYAPGAPVQAPIDGGLTALIIAGGAMGYKKLKNKRNDTTE